jgi:hypothetical protein
MSNDEETQRILYELLGRNKYEWLRTGKELITASNILYTESNDASEALNVYLEKAGTASTDEFIAARAFIPARMLTGMALESLIKGLIIMKYPDMVSKDKEFALKSHYLLQLLTTHLTEISLNAEEKALLKELENYIAWKGRYPIPLLAKNFNPHAIFYHETAIINSLYGKLLKQYSKYPD